MIRLLITDDDDRLRKVLSRELQNEGFEVQEARDGRAALDLLAKQDFDVLILDLTMPGLNGLEVLRHLQEKDIGVQVVILTANATISTAVEAMKLGAYDFLTKPVKLEELALVCSKAAEKQELVKENLLLRSRLIRDAGFPEIVTCCPNMGQLLEEARKVARTQIPVYIHGESGAGKELVARGIHTASSRSKKSFIAINCSAFSESMVESELFGHERGAFTGAHAQKPGLLEMANGGTFFIDEIGEMSPALQAKLLRVLETGIFFRVGGVKEVKVDVRILSASNRDLQQEVEKGSFRRDLFWRIAGFTLQVPPLRERKADIPLLVEQLLGRDPAFHHKKISKAALSILSAYHWPGNVRELLNVLTRAAILQSGDELQPADFPGLIKERNGPASLKLADVERDHILKVLKESEGHRGKAAEVLGIDPKTLYRKLRDYGISET